MADNFNEQLITNTLKENYMPYAMSVIISRAIPEIDGFKPSHRKLLYTLYKMGLLSGQRTKSANVVGQTMKLNPHGDMAIYETMVRMTRGNGALLHPYVDSKGNFGKQYSRDMSFAAARYTEVKLEKICAEIFADIDKNTVDFVDNYDGTLKEPTLLPTTFPNILVNANQGIAVGMASNICSFNLEEICNATIAYIEDPDADLTEIIKAPDFSTGAELIYNENEIRALYDTGRGSLRLRSKYIHDKKSSCIEITEIPYTTTSEAIMDKIIELIKGGKLKEINDVRDETDLSGLKITIDIKRNTDVKLLMSKLYKMTPLQDTYSGNFNILINGVPRVMGIKEILHEWISFRMGCIKNQIAFDIQKKSDKLHLLRGLMKILVDIDKAIAIIRSTESDDLVISNLMKGFGIDKLQAEFISEIKLRNLNKEYIINKTSETDNLAKEIDELKDILGSEKKIKKIIIKKLKEVIKNYGEPRKTEIVYEDDVVEIPKESFIDDFPVKVFFTEENYLKKISLVSLRSSGEQRIKDGDNIKTIVDATNKWDLILISNRCNAYKLRLYEVPDQKASNLGDYIPNIVAMEQDEKIVDIIATDTYEGEVLFAFENGKIARVPLKSFETKSNRKKLSNAYGSASPLVSVVFMKENGDICLETSYNKVLVVSSEAIPLKQSRSTIGVQVVKLNKKAVLSKMLPAAVSNIKNCDSYRSRKIPSPGYPIKNEDSEEKQLDIFNQI